VLSGGERSRVALARCIVRPSNVLFLDEPTNHLDIGARQSLLEALQAYEGSIVFISHDRHFMDGLAGKIFELREGRGTLHLGNYSDYRSRRDAEEAREARKPVEPPPKAAPKAVSQTPLPELVGPPKLHKRTIKWKIDALEKRIFTLEEELASIQARLADPEVYRVASDLTKLKTRYDTVQRECAQLTAEWEQLAELSEA